jgi:hypothetical protein
VTPTRGRTLLGLVLGVGLLTWLLAALAYRDLPLLPAYAPVSLALLAVVELGMAKVVRDRLSHRRDAQGRPRGRPLHPISVARAAVLAKASSTGGAILLGVYGGLLVWTLPRRDVLLRARDDALVAAISSFACLVLVVAALVLERACRRPHVPEIESPT